MIDIPNFKQCDIKHIVLDYNGTLATDGILLPKIGDLLMILCKQYTLHVITSDTFSSAAKQLEEFDVELKILKSQNHTQEKADYITSLGSQYCAAIGNGNNDSEMLKTSAIGIAVVGDEGCSTIAMSNADIVCKKSMDALMLFVQTKRLTATLRC